MKRIVLALFLIWAPPASGQASAPPTAAECRQFHIDLAREREKDYARALWAEGEARFDGHCLPKDSWRGIDLVERAVANGAEDAALWLRHFYEEIGDSANAAKWGRLFAIVLFGKYRDRVIEEIDGSPLPADVIAEWRAIVETLASGDIARIVADLDALAARPPIVRMAEGLYWIRSTEALELIDFGESRYQWARAALGGRFLRFELRIALGTLAVAADCGHPNAVRDRAERFMRDEPVDGPVSLVVHALARAHHATGRFGELLAAAERKLGRPAFRNISELIREQELAEIRCRPGRR